MEFVRTFFKILENAVWFVSMYCYHLLAFLVFHRADEERCAPGASTGHRRTVGSLPRERCSVRTLWRQEVGGLASTFSDRAVSQDAIGAICDQLYMGKEDSKQTSASFWR
jgi:hypothetical protein